MQTMCILAKTIMQTMYMSETNYADHVYVNERAIYADTWAIEFKPLPLDETMNSATVGRTSDKGRSK